MPERLNGGHALVVLGAVALIVSLFLHWYEPNQSAWTVFEAWDVVLAGIGVASILSVIPVSRGDVRGEHLVPERWMPALAGAALVIVVVALVNHPPAARDAGLQIGAWIAFAAAVVLAAGAILSRARISLVITLKPNESTGPSRRTPEPEPPPDPSAPEGDFEAETATQPLPRGSGS
jgi:ABC-type amino acid transport substrate-binding protein